MLHTRTVLLFVLVAVSAVNACNPVNISFDLCQTDEDCRYAFYIDENGDDFDIFSFLYHRFASPESLYLELETLLCSHEPNATVLPLDDFYLLWIKYLTKYRFCEDNEYFDSNLLQCTCKQDRICVFIHPRDMEFHSANYKILMWVIPIGLLAVLLVVIYKFKHVVSLVHSLDNVLSPSQTPVQQIYSYAGPNEMIVS